MSVQIDRPSRGRNNVIGYFGTTIGSVNQNVAATYFAVATIQECEFARLSPGKTLPLHIVIDAPDDRRGRRHAQHA